MTITSYLRRAYSSFVAHVFDIPARFMAFLLFLTLLFIPLMGLAPFYLSVLIQANVLAIFAASWDLLVGRTGQISLGHAVFFGIGAYSTAILSSTVYGFGLPLWVTIPIAMLVGSASALLIGFPCLRVKGPYLALVTMAFPLILQTVIKWTPLNPVFHGENGIKAGVPPLFPFLPIRPYNQQRLGEYYFSLIMLFICAIIIYKIANSKTGIVFASILDDELASKACGINTTKYKLMAFILSGLFATLAGALQAHFSPRGADPSTLGLTMSFTPVVVAFLGGIGTIYGSIVGAYVYTLLDWFLLRDLIPRLLPSIPYEARQYLNLLIFSLLVLIFVIKWPRGVARFTTDKLEDLEEARDLDERGPRIWKRYKRKREKSSSI